MLCSIGFSSSDVFFNMDDFNSSLSNNDVEMFKKTQHQIVVCSCMR
jgi:hypothetical protein